MLARIAVLSAVMLAAASTFPKAASAQMQAAMNPREITISASGTVTARPDQALVQIGVTSNARSAKAALDANTAAMRPVVDALKSSGIEDKDIQTSSFNMQPVYEYSQDGKPPKLTGYQVSNAVMVRVRALNRLGEVLDLVVGEGSNQISGVTFVVGKEDELRDEARKAAVANATRMARLYAQAAGVSLGEVQSITEASEPRQFGPLVAGMAPRASKSAGPAPIEPGEQTLEAQVTMVWTIK